MIADILFFIITAAWISEFIIFKNRKAGSASDNEKRSFPFIFILTASIIFLSVFSRETGFASVNTEWLSWTGLIIYGAGVWLRFRGITALGHQFTRHVNVAEGDRIVSSGPFRKLRHPLYTGLLMILTGIVLFLGSIAGFLLIIVLFVPVLLNRIRLEERMLTDAFGDDYSVWSRKRKKLIPFVY